MAKKHKGSKHEKVRKTVPATVPRASAQAAKLARQAKPRPVKLPDVGRSSATRLSIQPDRSESSMHDTPNGFEPQLIHSLEREPELEIRSHYTTEVEAADPVPDPARPFFEPDLPMPHRRAAAQSSDWDLDLAYKSAAEQVALAMLEAEKAAALCQDSDDFYPSPYSEAPPGLARLYPFSAESSSMASAESMESAPEEGPFAFDHI
jgi:hypothetical protein